MVLKLNNLSDWSAVAAGESVMLPGDRHRKVRLDVNTPTPTYITLTTEKGETVFLGVVTGLETLEFAAAGNLRLDFTGNTDEDVWIYTADNQQVAVYTADQETFTTPHQRRARNPEIEHLAHKMEQNMMRNMRIMQEELERKLKANTDAQRNGHSSGENGGTGASGAGESEAPGETNPDDSGAADGEAAPAA